MEVGKTQSYTSAFYQSIISPVLSYFRWPTSANLDNSEDAPSSNYFKTENPENSLASTAHSFQHLKNVDFHGWAGVIGSGSGMNVKGSEGLHTSLNPNHLWLIWFLSMIVFVFILFGCSLRNKYFQESFLLARAKQWVHLPVLNSAQDPLLLVEPGTVSYTVADCCSNGTDWESAPGLNEQQVDLTWVSETDKSLAKPEESSSKPTENDISTNQDNFMQPASLLPLGSIPQSQEQDDLIAMESQIISRDYLETPACLSPLTKTGSLDESQIGSCRKELQEKRFKANKSVEEFRQPSSNSIDCMTATPTGRGVGGGSSSPGTPQGKCRAKLQERRGSSHSLTIAVKSAENILPTVTTPRECSATQFLLTAGNCMNRHQLQSCLRDVKSLHAEFWSIPTNAPDPGDQATGSALKNRYRYVLPNPHSRVKLPCDPGDSEPGSGYINGNYIRAYDGKPGIYIATQGPLANTINDFWSMVWNEKAPAVIMITKLVESGRAKCESYLPDEENDGNFARYGRISVHVNEIDEHDGYIVRRLTLKNDDYPDRSHSTSHYWYSDWPDHKTPDNPRTLVDMAIAVESLRRSAGNASPESVAEAHDKSDDIRPIIVHCSAGVGRTGCFIALCQGLSQLMAEGRVDVLGIVCALRCDRGGMVQTAEQYEFIHRGLCLFERTLAD